MENETVGSKTWSSIRGSTIINHRLRMQYNLSYPEYVLLDYIQVQHEKSPGHKFDVANLQSKTGYKTGNELDNITSLLLDKGLIKISLVSDNSTCVEPTEHWLKNFDLTADFEEFWSAWGKVGNKQKAKDMYVRARKVVEKEVLHPAGKKYVQHNVDRFGENSTHASSYLNPKYKHWEDQLGPKAKPLPTKQDTAGQFNEEKF